MSANSTHCFGMAFPFPDTLIQFTGMSQWKTLMIYRCRITCFTIHPLQIVIYIVSQLAVSDLTLAFMSVQCYNLHTRVSFLRHVPLKFFWYPGNYTQHQETRFHKIIATERVYPERNRMGSEWRNLAYKITCVHV